MLKYILIVAIILLLIIINTIKNKLSKNILFILKTILIVLFLETTVFNINSYRTDFSKTKYKSFYGDDIASKIIKTENKTQYIKLDKLNTNVKSIYLDLSGLKEKEVVNYKIYYSDDSTSERYLASKDYCQDVEKTKYSVISLSRKMQKFKYRIR